MTSCSGFVLGAIVFGLTCSSASGDLGKSKELVLNPDFASSGGGLPDHWSIWTPAWAEAGCAVQAAPEGLLVEAPGKPYAVGGVFQEIRGIQGGQAYAIQVACQLRDIPDAYQSVLVRLSWISDGDLVHPAGMLVRGPVLAGNTARFEDVLIIPNKANGARLSLEVKWPQGGSVLWKKASMRLTSAPSPRKVKVGTVYLRPSRSTPDNNLKLFCEQIDAAGQLGLDIICLGEAITMVGTSADINDCAKPIPGPDTEMLGDAARRNHIWVVAGITELDGDVVYNTAVLLDRDGRIAGKYRKVHLPREEWRKGITPGGEYPVFQTDFGTIAIQICYDWFFPEPEAIFALKGAEIIFAPTWGNTLPDEGGRVNGETVFRVRARDNGVYMVPSVYGGNSLVIDPMGRILASSDGQTGVFWTEVDLNTRESLQWVGHWRSIWPRHRMLQTYVPLMKDVSKLRTEAEDLPVSKFYFPPLGRGLGNQDQRQPEEVGLDPAIVQRIDQFVRDNPESPKKGSQRWALWRHGYLIHVEGDLDETVDVASLRKTWHAMTVGAAIKQGKIPSYHQKISVWQTELEGSKAEATWRHVIMQAAGFDYPHGDHPDYKPGEMWTYSDWNPVHLCHALAKVYGKKDFYDNYDDVIKEAYFDAIGMEGWSTRIVYDRSSGMEDGIRFVISLEHMGRLGLLALARGTWKGVELIPRWFVEELETKQTYGMKVNYEGPYDGMISLRDYGDRFSECPYGYMTWVNTDRDYFPGADSSWAAGKGAGGTIILWNRKNGIIFAGVGVKVGPSSDSIPHIIEGCVTGQNPLLD